MHSDDNLSEKAMFLYVCQKNYLHYRALASKFLVLVEVKPKERQKRKENPTFKYMISVTYNHLLKVIMSRSLGFYDKLDCYNTNWVMNSVTNNCETRHKRNRKGNILNR